MKFDPILAKGLQKPPNVQRAVQLLSDFGFDLQAHMQDYPVQRSHIRYRRTGTLGRGWTTKLVTAAGSAAVTVGNNIEYAPFVQGFTSRAPRQVRWAAPYGWPSVETVGKALWNTYRPRIQAALRS